MVFLCHVGRMMPTQGDLYVAPFTDEMLYMEQTSKSQFWQQKAFYSLDLSALRQTALLEYFSQPIVVCKHHCSVFVDIYFLNCCENIVLALCVTEYRKNYNVDLFL